MKIARALALLPSLCAWSAAHAGAIVDPAAWTQSFIEQAVKGDTEAMSDLVSEGVAPGLESSSFRSGVQSLFKNAGLSRAQSAEAFNEVNIGSFIKRVNVVAVYQTSYLFYSFSLGRHEQGWYIYSYKIGGNLNEILNAPWPG